jgi:hypothetical protein
MHELVARYKNSSALGMWELINEPEMTCGNASKLKTFFDTVGGALKSIDPNHLLEMGVIGGNQCSLVASDYATVLSSPAIDVATFHDYGDETSPMPYPGTSGLAARITQAFAVNKPIIVGEAGFFGNDTTTCQTTAQRKSLFQAKMMAAFTAGVSGYMPWNWGLANTTCTYDIAPGDGLLTLLHDFVLPYDPRADSLQPTPPPSPSPTPAPPSPVPSKIAAPSPTPTPVVPTPAPLSAPAVAPIQTPEKTHVTVPIIAIVSIGSIGLLGAASFILYKRSI